MTTTFVRVGFLNDVLTYQTVPSWKGHPRKDNRVHRICSGFNGFSEASSLVANIRETKGAQKTFSNVFKGSETFPGTTSRIVVLAVRNDVPAVSVLTGTTQRALPVYMTWTVTSSDSTRGAHSVKLGWETNLAL